MKYKNDGNPIGNVGSCWNKVGRNEDFMLMKIQVDKPGNHVFVLFRNRNKGESESEFYDNKPAWYVFPYKPKNDDINGNNKE